MAVVNMDGYPQSDGAKIESVALVNGPTSYTTGGFNLEAVSVGMKAFDYVSATATAGGLHNVTARFTSSSTKTPLSTVKLIVYLTSSGLEVANGVDLSTSYFRVRALGL